MRGLDLLREGGRLLVRWGNSMTRQGRFTEEFEDEAVPSVALGTLRKALTMRRLAPLCARLHKPDPAREDARQLIQGLPTRPTQVPTLAGRSLAMATGTDHAEWPAL
jgi:hypothetical protein